MIDLWISRLIDFDLAQEPENDNLSSKLNKNAKQKKMIQGMPGRVFGVPGAAEKSNSV